MMRHAWRQPEAQISASTALFVALVAFVALTVTQPWPIAATDATAAYTAVLALVARRLGVSLAVALLSSVCLATWAAGGFLLRKGARK
jgi:hypothetical protein